MKQVLFLLLILLLWGPAFLHAGDDFLLLQKQFQEVSGEWNRYLSPELRNLLQDSSDPKARKLLKFREECIENFLETSRKIQKDLKGVRAADGLALVRHAEHLRGILQLCAGGVENEMTTITQNHKEMTAQAFQLVKTDLDFLKEIGFSCKDGLSAVSAEAQAWPELYRYKRQLQMLKTYLNSGTKSVQMGLTAQKKEFLREFSSISDAAEQLGSKAERAFPELADSAVLLPVVTRKLLEEARLAASSSRLKTAPTSSSSSGKSRSPSDRLQQISTLLRTIEGRIRADMRAGENLSEETTSAAPEEGAARRKPESDSGKKPSVATPKKEKRLPLERRSEEELKGELVRLRAKTLPDQDQTSLSGEERDQCLNLLSERERKQYETIRLRQIRSGTTEDEAPLEALKELKELLTAPDAVPPAKQEMIRILKGAAAAPQE